MARLALDLKALAVLASAESLEVLGLFVVKLGADFGLDLPVGV